ncbi:MAG: insulinase family protein [Alphaproteobacteria bacterium]|nr:insulinase family protein [Alphaproteobacteria bacterium]
MIKKILCIISLLVSAISSAEVKELTSSYGVKFWYHQDDSTPLINIAVAFRNCGAAHMSPTKRSVPYLYTSTALCGSGKYSKEEFQEKLQNISVKLYCGDNFDDVMFFCKYPKVVSDEAINLLLLALNSPKFEKKEVEENKFYISYRLRNYQDSPVFWYAYVMMPRVLFKNHPYGDGFGNSEEVLKLNRNDLKAFHKKYIVCSNIELCIFGDISETEAVKLADQILSSIPKGKKVQDNIPNVEPSLKNFNEKYHIERPQSYVLFTLPNVLENSEQKFATAILYRILGGGHFKSKIMEKLRSKLGLIYSGGINKIEHRHSCFSAGVLQTSNKKTDIAISEIKLILKKLKEDGISQEELDFAKSNIKGTFLVNLRTSEDLCHFYMTKKLQGYSTKALEEFLEGINAVTLEQVNSLAQKTLDEKNIPFIVIGGNE